jgi:hypothetical protein
MGNGPRGYYNYIWLYAGGIFNLLSLLFESNYKFNEIETSIKIYLYRIALFDVDCLFSQRSSGPLAL